MAASTSAKRLFTHGGVYALSRVANQAVGVLLIPLYARLIGDEGYGVISLMQTVAAFLGFVFLQGLHGAWFRLRFEETDAAGERRFEATIIWYLIGSGLAGLALLSLFGEPLARLVTPGVPYYPLGLLTAITAVAAVYATLYERKLQAQQRPAAFGLFSLARTMLMLGLILLFVAGLGRGAPGKIEATTLATCAGAAAAICLLRPSSPQAFSGMRLRRSLSYGLLLVPHSLAGLINDMIDKVLINAKLGLALTGVYSMGYQIASVGLTLATALNQAYAPMFIRSVKDADACRATGDLAGADAAMREVGRMSLLSVTAVALVVLALTAVSRELLIVLATPEFGDSWKIVAPVGAGVVAWACYFPFTQSIIYNPARTRWMAVVSGTAALVNIGANLALIPRWGIMGAAYSTLLSNTVMAGLAYRLGQASAPVPYQRGRWLAVLSIIAVGLIGLWYMDAWIIPTWTRFGAKLVWTAAIAMMTLRASNVRLKALRQLWAPKDATSSR